MATPIAARGFSHKLAECNYILLALVLQLISLPFVPKLSANELEQWSGSFSDMILVFQTPGDGLLALGFGQSGAELAVADILSAPWLMISVPSRSLWTDGGGNCNLNCNASGGL